MNIDINALVDEAKGSFYGYIPTTGTITLLGQSSGAQASVTNVRLVADTYGDLYGSFFFEDPLKTPAPSLRFKVGTSTFKLSSESTINDALEGSILLSEACH